MKEPESGFDEVEKLISRALPSMTPETRDRLLFAAGAASGSRAPGVRTAGWKIATAVLALTTLSLGVAQIREGSSGVEVASEPDRAAREYSTRDNIALRPQYRDDAGTFAGQRILRVSSSFDQAIGDDSASPGNPPRRYRKAPEPGRLVVRSTLSDTGRLLAELKRAQPAIGSEPFHAEEPR